MTPTLILSVLLTISASVAAEPPSDPIEPSTALLIIDVQEFYFPGGKAPLVNPEAASHNASRLLQKFRKSGRLVVHVRHKSEPGGSIHSSVTPINGERVFSKNEVSCFNGTDVLAHLKERGIKKLVICGMMTHMCVEAATRAAHDKGFECVVVGDACATRDLKYKNHTVAAADVHAATLATLSGAYAKVVDTDTFLSEN